MRIKKLLRIGAATLSDAMGKTGAMDHEMRPRSAVAQMAGPAFTVRIHPADLLMVSPALAACPAGHVLVIDGHGDRNTAIWGGITTDCAHRKGIAGVVIDGAIRDSLEISRSKLPVFARSIVPNAGGAEYVGEMNISVACGGIVIAPGDWVVGDEDGVVVIPAAQIDEVAARGEAIVAAEVRIKKAVRSGQDLASILKIDEVLRRKSSDVFIPQLRAGQ